MISRSDLILNPDGSIYHLNLHPDEIAEIILLVGDKDRVGLISALFDQVEIRKEKREFITHTGFYRNKRISIVSTGIGTDNIDIVVNEIDALKNIDFQQFKPKDETLKLRFIRIGTCGAIHPDILPGDAILSQFALGLDNLNQFYPFDKDEKEQLILQQLNQYFALHQLNLAFYLTGADHQLFHLFHKLYFSGITITAPGFYAPQGRNLRIPHYFNNLVGILSGFHYDQLRILNFEMESSALFGLSRLMNHQALTINLVVANRSLSQINVSYHKAIQKLAGEVLDRLVDVEESGNKNL